MKNYLPVVNIIFVVLALFFANDAKAGIEIESIQGATENQCNGSVDITITGNLGPYTYEWNNGAESEDLVGLCPGNYLVTVTNIYGCEETLTVELGGCVLNLETTIIQACSDGSKGSVYLDIDALEGQTFTIEWFSFEETSPSVYYSDIGAFYLDEGWYCVDINEQGSNCFWQECFHIYNTENCDENPLPPPPDDPPVIVNEASNGIFTHQEYIELLVIGDPDCSPTFDLRGFIIDDNNDDFSVNQYTPAPELHAGFATGHVRFRNIDRWKNVPVGSLICIYNQENRTLDNDPIDVNNDKIYVLPVNDNGLEGVWSRPGLYTSEGYNPNSLGYYGGSFDYIQFHDPCDAPQVRYPSGAYCHGISYGTPYKMTGGPHDLHVYEESGVGRMFYFADNDYLNKVNFFSESIVDNPDAETPGAPNNPNNEDYIEGICDGVFVETEDPTEELTLPPVIINELSNGESSIGNRSKDYEKFGYEEFIEILIIGTEACEDSFDLRGYIIDDNNGDFSVSAEMSSTGFAAGHIRFKDIDRWANVPVGSLLLIYNDEDFPPGGGDPTDANGDMIYKIPISNDGLEGVLDRPSLHSNFGYNPDWGNYYPAGWTGIRLHDEADAAQIRYPSGEYCHGISYGSSERMIGGVHGLHISNQSGKNNCIFFNAGNYLVSHNYKLTDVEYVTPGYANNPENADFIADVCNNVVDEDPDGDGTSVMSLAHQPNEEGNSAELREEKDIEYRLKSGIDGNAYPNPTRGNINLVLLSDTERTVLVQVIDALGITHQTLDFNLKAGSNTFNFDINKSKDTTGGVFFIKVTDRENPEITELVKIVVTR